MHNYHTLAERFPSTILTPSTRLIALIFFIVNIPGAILGSLSWVFVWPILISFPGLVLFVFYFKIWKDNVSLEKTISVWKGTIAYNFILIILSFAAIGLEAWLPALFMIVSIGFAGLAWRILWEKKWEEKNVESANEKAQVF